MRSALGRDGSRPDGHTKRGRPQHTSALRLNRRRRGYDRRHATGRSWCIRANLVLPYTDDDPASLAQESIGLAISPYVPIELG